MPKVKPALNIHETYTRMHISNPFINDGGAGSLPVASDGLVQYLDANNTDSYSGSGSTFFDLSPNGVDANIPATGVVFNAAEKVFDFNGTSFIDFTSGLLAVAQGDFTVEVLFNFAASTNSNSGIFSTGATSAQRGIIIRKTAQWVGAGNNSSTAIFYTIPVSQWIYLSYSRENGVLELKTNTVLRGQKTESAPFSDINRTDGVIGRNYTDSSNLYMTGKLAVSRFYNRKLTEQESLDNYNYDIARFL